MGLLHPWQVLYYRETPLALVCSYVGCFPLMQIFKSCCVMCHMALICRGEHHKCLATGSPQTKLWSAQIPSRPIHVSNKPLPDSTMEISVIAEGLHLLKNFLEASHSCGPDSFHLVSPVPSQLSVIVSGAISCRVREYAIVCIPGVTQTFGRSSCISAPQCLPSVDLFSFKSRTIKPCWWAGCVSSVLKMSRDTAAGYRVPICLVCADRPAKAAGPLCTSTC